MSDAPSLVIEVNLQTYSRNSVEKSAHKFSGHYFVEIEESSHDQITVKLTSRQPGHLVPSLRGDFINELLDQNLRLQIARETEPVRNLILAHALSGIDMIHGHLEDQASSS